MSNNEGKNSDIEIIRVWIEDFESIKGVQQSFQTDQLFVGIENAEFSIRITWIYCRRQYI